jgi:hypothetical protein
VGNAEKSLFSRVFSKKEAAMTAAWGKLLPLRRSGGDKFCRPRHSGGKRFPERKTALRGSGKHTGKTPARDVFPAVLRGGSGGAAGSVNAG